MTPTESQGGLVRHIKHWTSLSLVQTGKRPCLPPRVTPDYVETTAETNPDHRKQPATKKRSKGSDTAKKEAYIDLLDKATAAATLNDLADVLGETVATMKLYGSAAATKPCFKLLEEIHE
jgi:hypothetical protein